MASSGASAAKISNGAAAAAGSPSWTPTGGREISVRGPHVDTGKYHLEIRYDPRASSKYKDRKSITSLHEDYPGKPSFLGMLPVKSWSTEDAADEAKEHFRAWVDGGRRKRTAAANEMRNVRVPTDVIPLPERYSKRANRGTHVKSTSTIIPGDDGEVQVRLHLSLTTSDLDRDEYNSKWSEHSDALLLVAKKRRLMPSSIVQAMARLAANARDATREGMGVVARVAARSMHRRGKSRSAMVSVHRARGDRYRPGRHALREEVRLSRLQETVEKAHQWRVEHIERLKTILIHGTVSDLLDRGDGDAHEPLSAAHLQRLTTQGWALVCMYKELDRLESAVLAGQEAAPAGGELAAAAAVAGAEYGFHAETVRGWQLEYVSNEYKFVADGRGKWKRELLIHEEDLQRKFHKWMVSHLHPPPSLLRLLRRPAVAPPPLGRCKPPRTRSYPWTPRSSISTAPS